MTSVSINTANTGSGLYATATSYAAMDIEIIGLDIDGAAGDGVTLSGDTITAAISFADIANADNLGLSSDEAELSFTDSSISASGTSGAELLSGEKLTFSNNTITGNAEYGLICGDIDLSDCSGNAFKKNTSGDTLSCPSECSE